MAPGPPLVALQPTSAETAATITDVQKSLENQGDIREAVRLPRSESQEQREVLPPAGNAGAACRFA